MMTYQGVTKSDNPVFLALNNVNLYVMIECVIMYRVILYSEWILQTTGSKSRSIDKD